jgi:hypothetical protein
MNPMTALIMPMGPAALAIVLRMCSIKPLLKKIFDFRFRFNIIPTKKDEVLYSIPHPLSFTLAKILNLRKGALMNYLTTNGR